MTGYLSNAIVINFPKTSVFKSYFKKEQLKNCKPKYPYNYHYKIIMNLLEYNPLQLKIF